MSQNCPRTESITYRCPKLIGAEGDGYVFVAVLRDRTIDGASNWLSQTFHVDPTDGDDTELQASITERYHVSGPDGDIAFEDRFTIRLSLDAACSRPSVSKVRNALEQWYREHYTVESSHSRQCR